MLLLEQLIKRIESFDIIHFSIDCIHFTVARRLVVPHITTLHGRLDLPYLIPFYKEFNDIPVVSISKAQRISLPFANWQGTVIMDSLKIYTDSAESRINILLFSDASQLRKDPTER